MQQLKWCTELKFMGQKSSPYKLKTIKPIELQTFPESKKSLHGSSSIIDQHHLSSSTISDNNEFNDNSHKVIALASFPGSGK